MPPHNNQYTSDRCHCPTLSRPVDSKRCFHLSSLRSHATRWEKTRNWYTTGEPLAFQQRASAFPCLSPGTFNPSKRRSYLTSPGTALSPRTFSGCRICLAPRRGRTVTTTAITMVVLAMPQSLPTATLASRMVPSLRTSLASRTDTLVVETFPPSIRSRSRTSSPLTTMSMT